MGNSIGQMRTCFRCRSRKKSPGIENVTVLLYLIFTFDPVMNKQTAGFIEFFQ